MSNMYRSVLSGGGGATGDAVAADVLTGKTFSNAQATGISGTMPNNGTVSKTLDAGESYTIPEGYHNGNGVVTAAMDKVYPDTGKYYIFVNNATTEYDIPVGSSINVPTTAFCIINLDGKSTITTTSGLASGIMFGKNGTIENIGAAGSYSINGQKYAILTTPNTTSTVTVS